MTHKTFPCLTGSLEILVKRTGLYLVSPGTGTPCNNELFRRAEANLGQTYSGQHCTAGSRFYIQASIYDKFIKLLIQKANEFVVGDPFDEQAAGRPLVRTILQSGSAGFDFGIQISKAQYDHVWGFIESGKQEGSKVVVGGEKRNTKGFNVDSVGEGR